MTNKTLASLPLFLALSAFLFAGCESSDSTSGNYWKSGGDASAAEEQQAAAGNGEATGIGGDNSGPNDPNADEISFGNLNWSFGGVDGSGAVKTSASLGDLKINGGDLSYKWTGDTLRVWGLSDSSIGALACLFVQRNDNTWVGGKFDWISTSRTTRTLENILDEHYNGWSLANVPNPCRAAFVIISADAKKRTNVALTLWRR